VCKFIHVAGKNNNLPTSGSTFLPQINSVSPLKSEYNFHKEQGYTKSLSVLVKKSLIVAPEIITLVNC
jgi:hypothetical protein